MTKYQQVPEVGQQASLSEAQRITRPDFIDLPMTGLEGPMTEEERALQESVHRFAEDVMRPVAAKLDRLSAEEMIAEGSELWTVLSKANDLGLSLVEMEEMEPLERARMLAIAIEELAWGCPGLCCAVLPSQFCFVL